MDASRLLTWVIAIVIILAMGTAQPGGAKSADAPELIVLSEGACREILSAADHPQDIRIAARHSLTFLKSQPKEKTFSLGGRAVSVTMLRHTLDVLLESLDSGSDWPSHLCGRAKLLRFSTPKPLVVTGYYEPALAARLERNSEFRYPIYAVPSRPVTASRAEIERAGLDGRAGVIAWLDDPVEVFFLHVQGSGVLRLQNGKQMHVGYAGSNGRAYTSIGRWLVKRGEMRMSDVTMQSIKQYLQAHSQELQAILNVNERYVFFRILEGGPLGSIRVPLTPCRSIAADQRLLAPGAPAFLTVPGLAKASPACAAGIVFVQDSGSAITGPSRLDLFTGTGEAAGELAGGMRHKGELYLLLSEET